MKVTDAEFSSMHISRSWRGTGHPLEDECPCPQEPCGYIARDKIVVDCPEHGPQAARTLRDNHLASECSGGSH